MGPPARFPCIGPGQPRAGRNRRPRPSPPGPHDRLHGGAKSLVFMRRWTCSQSDALATRIRAPVTAYPSCHQMSQGVGWLVEGLPMPDAKRRVWMRGRGGSAAALRCRLTTAVEPATPSTLVADRHVLATSLRLVL